MNTEQKIDQELDQVTLRQLAFKDDTCKRIAIRIVESFLPDRIQWGDEIDLGDVDPDDKNVIGCTWRRLAKLGIIKRMEGADDHRRSKVKSRRGGIVWKYRLANAKLAETFLKRNVRAWNCKSLKAHRVVALASGQRLQDIRDDLPELAPRQLYRVQHQNGRRASTGKDGARLG